MGNDLTIADNIYVSVPHADPVSAAIMVRAKCASYREFGVLRMFHPPAPTERAALSARRNALIASMSFDKDKVGLLVTRMLQGFRTKDREAIDASAGKRPPKILQDVALYVRELRLDPAIPTWAVALACNAIRLNQVPDFDPRFGEPSTAVLRRICDSFIWDTRAEIVAISDVLSGTVAPRHISPEERAMIGPKFTALAAELKARQEANNALESEAAKIEALKASVAPEVWDSIPDRKPFKQKTVGEYLADCGVPSEG